MNKKENPKAFKHWISKDLVLRMAMSLKNTGQPFQEERFKKVSLELNALELKPRVLAIAKALKISLSPHYPTALETLLKSFEDETLKGFDLWPYTQFVQDYGLEYPELSLKALKILTTRFTSEFAVRPFLIHHTAFTLKFLKAARSETNHHVRRWVSEGSRPRLPWSEKLKIFIQHPHRTLALIKPLVIDNELYVRKSVANHLNDISKDHPELAIKAAKSWLKENKHARDRAEWVIRHGLRTLIKNGNTATLKLFGTNPNVPVRIIYSSVTPSKIKMGQTLTGEIKIKSLSKKREKIILDYVLFFKSAHSVTTRNPKKVFKLKSFYIEPGEVISIKKEHSIKPITTRRFYNGEHAWAFQINGRLLKLHPWLLTGATQ